MKHLWLRIKVWWLKRKLRILSVEIANTRRESSRHLRELRWETLKTGTKLIRLEGFKRPEHLRRK
jgi:hypothetical protein